MEESEPDELGQLEKLEMEYQEEVRRKVRCQLVGILGLKSCVSSRGRSPTISVSILCSVCPVGTVAPEITKKAANLNLSRLARLESTPRILKKFSRLFLFREKSCLACLELRGHSTHRTYTTQYRH